MPDKTCTFQILHWTTDTVNIDEDWIRDTVLLYKIKLASVRSDKHVNDESRAPEN